MGPEKSGFLKSRAFEPGSNFPTPSKRTAIPFKPLPAQRRTGPEFRIPALFSLFRSVFHLVHYRKRGSFENRLGEFNAVIGPHLSSPKFRDNVRWPSKAVDLFPEHPVSTALEGHRTTYV